MSRPRDTAARAGHVAESMRIYPALLATVARDVRKHHEKLEKAICKYRPKRDLGIGIICNEHSMKFRIAIAVSAGPIRAGRRGPIC